MIRDDIKLYLQENHLNIDDIFLMHRNTDPKGYRVGKMIIKEQEVILALNEITGTIMDYFYDDHPEILEFDISEFLVFEDGRIESEKYYISRDGKLRSNYTNRYLTIQSQELYPSYSIKLVNSKNRLAHSKRLQIHKVMASVFVPNFNPETRIFVDHINRNCEDYSINNLRWVTNKENRNNSTKRVFAKRRQYMSYKDKEFTIPVDVLSDEELLNHDKYKRHVILDSLSGKNYHYGLYWKIVDLNLLDYLSSIDKTLEDIDETLWTDTRLLGVKAHPLGLLKITTQKKSHNRTYITPGYVKHKKYKYYVVRIQGVMYLVHRLISETFLNGNKEIEDQLEVDHINSIATDNQSENLRICTHKENMNNSETKIKLSTALIANGRVFNSITECSNFYGVSRSTIVNWIKNGKEGFSFIN